MSDEETHIEKRRTTALKIIVDEKTRETEYARRKFLADLFDYPEYAQAEEITETHVTRPVNGTNDDFIIYDEVLAILKHNNVDVTGFAGYKEEKKIKFRNNTWDLDERIKEVTDITDQTYLHYKFGGKETTKHGIDRYYLQLELQTSGKTKTEIKGVHKQNVCKFLNYLKMRKVLCTYDCEWSFEGNRSCTL